MLNKNEEPSSKFSNHSDPQNTEFVSNTVHEEDCLEKTPIYVATMPIDFRCSIDGLCMYIAEHWNKNPQAGIYVFYNHKRDKVKLIYWDYNGFVLFFKRLEKGRFEFIFDERGQAIQLTHQQLSWLLMGIDWRLMSRVIPIQFNQYA